jgi:hypothetical protein
MSYQLHEGAPNLINSIYHDFKAIAARLSMEYQVQIEVADLLDLAAAGQMHQESIISLINQKYPMIDIIKEEMYLRYFASGPATKRHDGYMTKSYTTQESAVLERKLPLKPIRYKARFEVSWHPNRNEYYPTVYFQDGSIHYSEQTPVFQLGRDLLNHIGERIRSIKAMLEEKATMTLNIKIDQQLVEHKVKSLIHAGYAYTKFLQKIKPDQPQHVEITRDNRIIGNITQHGKLVLQA